jgi:hypothetical protein
VNALVLPSVNRPFVKALRRIADTAGTWSVIGGFAVWCHLGEGHRPTLDIDTAASDLDDKNRLFVTAHWAAARLTTEMKVRCDELEVTVPVARRLPLVACKLHAWLDRRDQRAEKRGSDGLDIVRLLQTADWDAMSADSREVDGLAQVVTWAGSSALVDQVGGSNPSSLTREAGPTVDRSERRPVPPRTPQVQGDGSCLGLVASPMVLVVLDLLQRPVQVVALPLGQHSARLREIEAHGPRLVAPGDQLEHLEQRRLGSPGHPARPLTVGAPHAGQRVSHGPLVAAGDDRQPRRHVVGIRSRQGGPESLRHELVTSSLHRGILVRGPPRNSLSDASRPVRHATRWPVNPLRPDSGWFSWTF